MQPVLVPIEWTIYQYAFNYKQVGYVCTDHCTRSYLPREIIGQFDESIEFESETWEVPDGLEPEERKTFVVPDDLRDSADGVDVRVVLADLSVYLSAHCGFWKGANVLHGKFGTDHKWYPKHIS